MLNQISHWLEYAASGVDLVLVFRILSLRLHRTYLFLTLVCVLAVLFDAANLFYGQDLPRVQIYSEFFLACIFPLAAWDIFEEISAQVGGLRRLAMLRTLASLIIISFFGLVWLSTLSMNDDPTGLAYPLILTMTVSTASAGSCLGYLWIMKRGMEIHKVAVRPNTLVWMTFFALLMIGQLLVWFELMSVDFLNQSIREVFSTGANLALNTYGIVITLWCAAKLRGLPKDLPTPVSETEPGP